MGQTADPLDPALFAPSQARDSRFDVRDRWAELANHPPGTPAYVRE